MIFEIGDARGRLHRLNVIVLTGFGLVAMALAYWIFIRGTAILGREDNPRLVEAELRIQRGAILDANSMPLAITSGEDDTMQRRYPVPSAAPAVGYYSLRHGTVGVEQAYDNLLRGEMGESWSGLWRSEMLGEPQIGRDVRLTLDSRWQAKADELLEERSGAVFLFSLPDVEVRAMASGPGYDANQLDAAFDQLVADERAPLLNRVTQGQYQPGLLLQPFLLAIGQRDGWLELTGPVTGISREIFVDDFPLACQGSPAEPSTWARAMAARCPGPMLALAEKMDEVELLRAIGEFGFLTPPELPITTEGASSTGLGDVGLAAIGQDSMAVSPLQVGLALATLANDGQFRQAQMVLATQDSTGAWIAEPAEAGAYEVVPAHIATEILALFSETEGISEHDLVVLSGPEGNKNSWYLGLAPAANPRYGVVVVIENDGDPSFARAVGRELLKGTLDPEE